MPAARPGGAGRLLAPPPREDLIYRLIRDRFVEFALVHEERFEARDGPLRPVVRRVVEGYLDCGLLENGFARVRCPECRAEYFCAFSCQTRNSCATCHQKWALLLAERLRDDVLAAVEHSAAEPQAMPCLEGRALSRPCLPHRGAVCEICAHREDSKGQ